MKRNKKSVSKTVPTQGAVKPAIDTEQQRKNQEWEAGTKFGQYYAKIDATSEQSKLDDKRFHQAMQTMHYFMDKDEWFYRNTPFPFKVTHWSPTHNFAMLACRYLKKIALYDNNMAICTLANIAIEMTETLTELLDGKTDAGRANDELINTLRRKGVTNKHIDSNAELLAPIARDLPYWPMLRFVNTAANSQSQFQLIAAQLKLGSECPINVSESARYSFKTPINAFVWKCLRHFVWVHSYLHSNVKKPESDDVLGPSNTYEEAIEHVVFSESVPQNLNFPFTTGMIERESVGIYKVSMHLPPLTKSTAKEWADKALMPHVKIRFPDLRKVPELKGIDVGSNGKKYAPTRKAVIQSLQQMARK